jgi:signal transduction histidine kinase
MPGPVLRMANTLVGLRYSLFCPLIVRGRVLGALSFHGPAPFPVHIQRVCLAFARQAALALDNAHLLETLREQVDELKLSRERIVISDERLRKEIAELLHGRVQNQLLVAWHRVGQAMEAMKTSPEEVRRLLSEARDGIDAVREQDVRRASHLLHPAIIRVGLLPAIRSLAGQLGSTGPAIAVNVDPRVQTLDDPEVGHIPESTRLAAYRVTEEALNNVYRHAKARHVEITLQLDERDRLELEIRDDGEGFNRDHMKPGLGLGNIAARLGQVGGTWSIYSSLGRGTTLLARIPIATN